MLVSLYGKQGSIDATSELNTLRGTELLYPTQGTTAVFPEPFRHGLDKLLAIVRTSTEHQQACVGLVDEKEPLQVIVAIVFVDRLTTYIMKHFELAVLVVHGNELIIT